MQLSSTRRPTFQSLRALVVTAVLLPGAARVVAQQLSLVAPATPWASGGSATVDLLLLNDTTAPLPLAAPAQTEGRLSDGQRTWVVTLQGSGPELVAAPGGFARRKYTLALPADAVGRLALDVSQPQRLRTFLEVAAPDPTAERHVRAGLLNSEPTARAPGVPAAIRLKRYYADHFSAHEPMYAVGGGEEPAVKFQLSLKYRLLNENGPLATRFPHLNGLHVGYTQRSLWDITADSSPFFDTSYMPEVLFEAMAPDRGQPRGFNWIGYQVGVQHESNGRDGDNSRSLDTVYIRPIFTFGNLDGWRLILRPKFLAYLSTSSKNDRIKDYRGYSELRAIFGRHNRLSVSLTGRIGADFDKGSVQVDVTYPTEFISGNFSLYLMAQYWSGYGESLLRYDQKTETVRAGLSLAR
jgi:phospholipase A1